MTTLSAWISPSCYCSSYHSPYFRLIGDVCLECYKFRLQSSERVNRRDLSRSWRKQEQMKRVSRKCVEMSVSLSSVVKSVLIRFPLNFSLQNVLLLCHPPPLTLVSLNSDKQKGVTCPWKLIIILHPANTLPGSSS